MPASSYLAQQVLNGFLRGVAVTLPTKIYISLHTADPGDTGANEVTAPAWPSYLRRDAANGGAIATGFDAVTGIAKATENALQITFPTFDGAAALTVTHYGIWDDTDPDAGDGNLLFYGPLTASRTLNPSDILTFLADAIDVSLA